MEYKETENGQILRVESIKTEIQTAIVETYHDMKYHTRLRYESEKILCEVWTYLDETATDYNANIIFEYDGQTITVQAVNGIATIEFTADTNTQHTVRTVNEKMRNGEVTFFA